MQFANNLLHLACLFMNIGGSYTIS